MRRRKRDRFAAPETVDDDVEKRADQQPEEGGDRRCDRGKDIEESYLAANPEFCIYSMDPVPGPLGSPLVVVTSWPPESVMRNAP